MVSSMISLLRKTDVDVDDAAIRPTRALQEEYEKHFDGLTDTFMTTIVHFGVRRQLIRYVYAAGHNL
jgi:hypothetical protein